MKWFFSSLVTKYKDAFFYYVLSRNLTECDSVLDVGCGAHSPLAHVQKTFYSEGIDIFKKSIQESKRLHIHDAYRQGNILHITKWYSPKSFDAVVALDVVEHIEKKEALQLIKKMETIARKKIIIMTPNGFHDQHIYDNNPYQRHRSGWTVDEFTSRHFVVRGLRGFKTIRGEYASIKLKPWLLWALVAFVSEPLLVMFPNWSYQLFATKKLT